MKVSVAIATYNGARYLDEQLQSILDQHRLPDEIIISDDNSIDNTMAIIQDFSKIAPFDVQYYRNKINLGYAGNFNTALEKVSGDLVFLCDQDDVWFPEKIAYMELLAKNNPDALVLMNDASFTDENLNEVGLTKLGQIHSAGFSESEFVMGCCCAIRRELIDLCLPVPQGFSAHDTWIINFADALKCKLVSRSVLQYYRRHGNNESKYIANRLTTASRIDFYFQQIKNIKEGGQADTQLKQVELFLMGVDRALTRNVSRNNYVALEIVKEQKYRELILQRNRFAIRRMSVVKRYLAVLKNVFRGGYRGRAALKNIILDLIE